ncbi:MAG: VWA domain-containing protein [Chitinophagales bacterium]|nr:VWA domain-containing protein [Chitinophagales bacterium]
MIFSGTISQKVFVFSFLCLLLHNVTAQQTQTYKPAVTRILFVLDGSGSMKQNWGNKTKFETARELLFKMVDSVERKNPNVEFAVRVFGYQYFRDQKNCTDSRLLVPFAKNNAEKIRNQLSNIRPQGMSPIAYSVQQGAKDFPDDAKSLNAVILITDGEENCGGDACKTAKELSAKRITLKPFIVGLNVEAAYSKLECMGTFYDTKDEQSLYNTVGVIIKQTLNTTTAQVNLLDRNNQPTVTNIPFTLYDHYSGKALYNFVHTMNDKGNPDTLFLDPVGVYDLELHTFPPLKKENVELVPGKHNIIALDVPAGDFAVECYNASVSNNDAQVLTRPKKKQSVLDKESILNAQNLNEQVKYIGADYRMEILTTPPLVFDTTVVAFAESNVKIANYGTLSLMASENLLVSIYTERNNVLRMIERFEMAAKTENRKLQPGEYRIVYKPKSNYESESTKSQLFSIEDGRTVVISLQ